MSVTFSTFVTPTRDSDTRIAGADAWTSATRGTCVGSIDSGAYRRGFGASRRAADALTARMTAATLTAYGTLVARPEKGAPHGLYEGAAPPSRGAGRRRTLAGP